MTVSPASANPQADLLAWLKANCPEAFTEGKLDPEKLRKTLAKDAAPGGTERYELKWAGKDDCFRVIQETTTATLAPDPEASVDFDTTKNLVIEGDNLQVLKAMQKSYYGKVKMVYIDPPYNTGSDSFVYPDKFGEDRAAYLARSGETDEEGNAMRQDFFRSNTKDNGHYHSNWLSMIYPRLFLARNLLRQDGVIFVSIDDNEVHNLRCVMDEIFGEENFEGHLHWRRRHNQPNDPTKLVGLVAEHILVYAKNSAHLKIVGVGKIGLTGKFSNPDNDPRGPWASKPWKIGTGQSGSQYTITLPSGKKLDGEWMGEETTYKVLLRDGRIVFPKKGDGSPRKKYYQSEREEEGQCATNWWPYEQFGSNQDGSSALAELLSLENVFSNPKPTSLVSALVSLGNLGDDDLVVDFFAGSGTTAHAVMALNAQDGGNRRFVCVQFPEELSEKESPEAFKFCQSIGKPAKISEICLERIRRAGKKMAEENPGKALDTGFRALRLRESNFRAWRSDVATTEALDRQLELAVENVDASATDAALLVEIALKSGLDLSAPMAAQKTGDKEWYLLDGRVAVCLVPKAPQALVDAVLAAMPEKAVFLDRCFAGDDKVKTNAALQFKGAGVEFVTL